MREISDELFNELKTEAIKIWKTYDNTYGYVDEKLTYLNSFTNVKDNYGTIIGMFDSTNQQKLFNAVSDEAKKLITDWTGGSIGGGIQKSINDKLVAGGIPQEYIDDKIIIL